MTDDIDRDIAARAGEALGDCARIVRREDPDRFLTAVTAPPDRRGGLLALYAFNVEVAKTREAVTEAMLGDIRLQWWRETVEGCFEGTPRRHEVAVPLSEAVRATAPDPALFTALIDGRERDLDDTPPTDMAAFESYARATSGGLIRLASQMIGVAETETIREAANDLGVAYALVGSIRALPFQVRQKRTMLPWSAFAEAGVDEATLYSAKPSEALTRALGPLLDEAERRIARARERRRAVPGAATPAFLSARVAAAHLRRLRRVGGNPYDRRLAAPPPLRALSVAWGARTGRW